MNFLNSKFYAVLESISNFFLLNLLWILVSMPLITLFPATAAMFGVIRDWVLGKDRGIFQNFFKHFKSNFKQSFILGIFFFVFTAIFIIDFLIIDELGSVMSVLVLSLLFVLGIIVSFIMIYVFPVTVHFDLPLKGILKNSLFYSIMFFPTTIVSILLVLLMITLVLFLPISFIFAFSLTAYLIFRLCYRNFVKVTIASEE